jgi:hypothetical protein
MQFQSHLSPQPSMSLQLPNSLLPSLRSFLILTRNQAYNQARFKLSCPSLSTSSSSRMPIKRSPSPLRLCLRIMDNLLLLVTHLHSIRETMQLSLLDRTKTLQIPSSLQIMLSSRLLIHSKVEVRTLVPRTHSRAQTRIRTTTSCSRTSRIIKINSNSHKSKLRLAILSTKALELTKTHLLASSRLRIPSKVTLEGDLTWEVLATR